MEIKASQFFSHYVRHPGELMREKVPFEKKLGLLVASVALWVFTFGTIVFISRALHNRSIKVVADSDTQAVKVATRAISKAAAEELKTQGEKMTPEQLSEVDLKIFKGPERKEKFYALFQIEEGKEGSNPKPSEKAKAALASVDLKTFVMNIDLLQPLEDHLPKVRSELRSEQRKKLFFSVDECHEIGAMSDRARLEAFLTIFSPSQIEGEKAFNALFSSPEAREAIADLSEVSLRKFAPLFSKEHWDCLQWSQVRKICSAINRGLFLEDVRFIEEFFNKRPEAAKEILIHNIVVQSIVELFPFLSKELQDSIPVNECPVSKEEFKAKMNIEHPLSREEFRERRQNELFNKHLDAYVHVDEYMRVPHREKQALLRELSKELNEKSSSEAKRDRISELFDQFPEEILYYLGPDDISQESFENWADPLDSLSRFAERKATPAEKEVFKGGVNALLQKYPPTLAKQKLGISGKDALENLKIFLPLFDEESRKLVPIQDFEGWEIAALLPYLTQDLIQSVTAKQFDEFNLVDFLLAQESTPITVANLSALFRRHLEKGNEKFNALDEEWKNRLIDEFLDEEWKKELR